MNASLNSSVGASTPTESPSVFDLLLASAGVGAAISEYDTSDVIFTQGDPANEVMYIQRGIVKKSVISPTGKEAVVAVLGPGEFFGEECLAEQPNRMATASVMTASTVLIVDKTQMFGMLHRHPALADIFLSHALSRLIRTQEDFLDRLFNPSEKRLARALLLLARDGKTVQPQQVVPKLSQETLGEMVGTTRSRVSFFMNKFKKLGFIDYNCRGRGLTINSALLSVIRQDD
jgi:CRP/FNR family transcriptional regulator, cyclic AMP receptor protein